MKGSSKFSRCLGIFGTLVLLCAACSHNDLLGNYIVVDMERTLQGVKEVPAAAGQQMTLPEYRKVVRQRYEGKTLEFTSDPPHEFLARVHLEGAVRGAFPGGWMRDPDRQNGFLLYHWVSGSVYSFWGHAVFTNGLIVVTLAESPGAPVLYLKKARTKS